MSNPSNSTYGYVWINFANKTVALIRLALIRVPYFSQIYSFHWDMLHHFSFSSQSQKILITLNQQRLSNFVLFSKYEQLFCPEPWARLNSAD